MLNALLGAAVPVVAAEDGMIERFAGDAIMVVFNAAGDQPDHALRAVRAALAFADASEAVAAGRPDWPRFRVGINTRPGRDRQRRHRRAAQLHRDRRHDEPRRPPPGAAEPGRVVIGPATHARSSSARRSSSRSARSS